MRESRRWNNTAAGHHGRFCEYKLLSLMLASERAERNKSQFQRLSTARCLSDKAAAVGLIWIEPFVARRDAYGCVLGAMVGVDWWWWWWRSEFVVNERRGSLGHFWQRVPSSQVICELGCFVSRC